MNDGDKTKEQLINELAGLRRQIAELEAVEAERKRAEEELKDSEERLRILFEFAPDAYYLNDLKGNFVDGNKAAEEIIGYKREELIGKNFLELRLLPPGQIPKAAAHLAKNVLGQPTGPDEFTLNRKDGSQVVVEIRTFPVRIKGQALVLGIARDITGRKRAEEALQKAHDEMERRVEERTAELAIANEQLRREIKERKHAEEALRGSEERYRLHFENVTDVIYSIDSEFRVLSVSPSVERILGYKPDELIGRHFPDLNILASDYLETAFSDTMRVLAGERVTSVYEFIAKDGTRKFGEVSGAPLVRDEVVAVISVARDITERKQTEEALRRAEAESQKRLKEQTALREAGAVITSTLDLIDVLSRIAEQMGQAIDATSAYICSVEPETGQSTVLAEYFSPHACEQEKVTDLGVTYVEEDTEFLEALRAGEPYVNHVDAPSLSEDERDHLLQYGAQSVLAIPLYARGRVIGYVELWESRRRREFTPEEVTLCQTIAQNATIAIENARLHAETERRLQEQIALREASAAISSGLDPQAVLPHIAEQMAWVVDATSAYICSFEPETMMSTVLAEYIGPQACPQEKVSDLGATYVEGDVEVGAEFLETMQAGKHEISHIDDPNLSESERAHMQQCGGQTILYIPLRVRGRLLGFAELWESRRRREFTAEEITLCHDIAQQAAIAIENAWLYEAEAQRRQEAETLREVAGVLITSLDRERVLQLILEQLVLVVNYDSASVMLVSDDALDIVAQRGFRSEDQRFTPLRVKALGHVREVLEQRLPVIVPDTAADSRWLRLPDSEYIRCWLGVPLMVKDRVIGLLNLDKGQPGFYTERDAELAVAFADQAAVAIENARLYEQAQQEISERVRAERLLRALNQAALAMERALTREEIFAAVADEFKRLGFSCAVFLADKSRSRLFPTYLSHEARGIKAVEKLVGLQYEDFTIPVKAADACRKAVWEKEAAFVENAEEVIQQLLPEPLKRFAGRIARMLKVPRAINAPLIVENEVIGVLSVQSDDLTEDDMPAITAFAHQMAAAWHKADLMQDLERSLGELKRTQAQLVQAQKMEALGQLAAGIAHDFNNLLTPISGFTELLLLKAPESSQQQEYLRQIKVAAERAAALTRQLRFFTRQARGERRSVQLNNVVEEIHDLLERSIPKEIAIALQLEPELWAVEADPAQMSQVLMNLCLNARDAMPDGGTLTLETCNVTLDEGYTRTFPEARPGSYMRLSVSDTGCGMSPEVQARLFEPFFTTKQSGEGTGLGLAVVYGIVKGHDGFIQVYSEEGRGSTFHVYLLAMELAVEEREVEGSELPTGTETILVVDDEEAVRALGQGVLERCGYTVLTAGDGLQALEVYQAYREEIALVVLDVVMPEMGGLECLRRLRELDPQVKVLISTGYTAKGLAEELVAKGALGMVDKPFRLQDFAAAVRMTIDG